MPTVALATEFFDAFAALPRAQQKNVREFRSGRGHPPSGPCETGMASM